MAALRLGGYRCFNGACAKRVFFSCEAIAMAANGARYRVLQLYKRLLREGAKFNSYNYRNYALRRVKDAFRENKSVCDADKIEELYQYGLQNLEVIRRQTVIGMLYGAPKLVIEQQQPNEVDKQ